MVLVPLRTNVLIFLNDILGVPKYMFWYVNISNPFPKRHIGYNKGDWVLVPNEKNVCIFMSNVLIFLKDVSEILEAMFG